jgi:hypothetical protein
VVIGQLAGQVVAEAVNAEHAPGERSLAELSIDLALAAADLADATAEHTAITRLERLREPEFAEHLWTDHLTIPQVADRIAASAALTLAANTDSALRGRLRRAWTGVKHIRFG